LQELINLTLFAENIKHLKQKYSAKPLINNVNLHDVCVVRGGTVWRGTQYIFKNSIVKEMEISTLSSTNSIVKVALRRL